MKKQRSKVAEAAKGQILEGHADEEFRHGPED